MAVIWGLSTEIGGGEETARFFIPLVKVLFPWAGPDQIRLVHGLVRKLGHLAEYAILAGLWFRALHGGRHMAAASSAWAALALSVAWAGLDELHQTTVASRTGTWLDVLLDAVGAMLALVAARLRERVWGRPRQSLRSTSREGASG
jgi:VanZ family protein